MSLKRKVTTLNVLKSTLNVWEVIAVNRYKKLSSHVGATMPYFLRLQEVLEHLYALYAELRPKLLELRDERSIDVLVLTTDRGYVGDFVVRTLRVLEEFLYFKKDKKVSLFIAGRRGALSRYREMGAKVFEDMLTKDINWELVDEIRQTLVGRFIRGMSDACYVLFQRPEVHIAGLVEMEVREKREALFEESPFFYPKFEEVLKAKPPPVVERGRYRPIVSRFLPPDIRKRYSKDTVMNIEGDEEELIHKLLEMYITFYMKEVFLEHFTSVNFARYRTISRILENIDRKLVLYKRLMNKLRQEKITKEIQDIVFSFIATEESRLRDYLSDEAVLEVDVKMPRERVDNLLKALESLGIEIGEVRRKRLIGGFRILKRGEFIDLSALRTLKDMELLVRKGLLRSYKLKGYI